MPRRSLLSEVSIWRDLGYGYAREEWWADKLVVPPLGPQIYCSSCSQPSVGFHQKSDRTKVRDASRDQAWRRRCALARGGLVSYPCLDTSEKNSTEGRRWNRRKRTGRTGRSARRGARTG